MSSSDSDAPAPTPASVPEKKKRQGREADAAVIVEVGGFPSVLVLIGFVSCFASRGTRLAYRNSQCSNVCTCFGVSEVLCCEAPVSCDSKPFRCLRSQRSRTARERPF